MKFQNLFSFQKCELQLPFNCIFALANTRKSIRIRKASCSAFHSNILWTPTRQRNTHFIANSAEQFKGYWINLRLFEFAIWILISKRNRFKRIFFHESNTVSTESSFSTPKRPQDSIFMLISNYTHSWHNLFNVNRIESIHQNLNLILDADLFSQRNI